MDIQVLYDSLTPYERQQFANKNVDVITDTLTDDDSVDLLRCSNYDVAMTDDDNKLQEYTQKYQLGII